MDDNENVQYLSMYDGIKVARVPRINHRQNCEIDRTVERHRGECTVYVNPFFIARLVSPRRDVVIHV